MTRSYIAAGRIALLLVLMAAWHMTAHAAGPLYMAPPLAVVHRLAEWTTSGALASHASATVWLAFVGFAAGCSAGVALPLLLYRVPRLNAALEPYIIASAGIPKYAIVPLLVLWLGIDNGPKRWLIGLLVFYPVFIAVSAGTRHVDTRLVTMGRVLGGRPLDIARRVIWPSILPFFFASLRVAVPRAVSAAIVAELLVGERGVGHLIESARQNVDMLGVLAGVTIATGMVLGASGVVRLVEHFATPWTIDDQPRRI